MSSRRLLLAVVCCLSVACSGTTETQSQGATGGASGASGNGGLGGNAGTGSSSTGGSVATGGSSAGGTAGSGGLSKGGSAGTGGAFKGGSAGVGGATGGSAGIGGTAGGLQASAECSDVSQCTLSTDCCNCLALAPGEQAPVCTMPECYVTACGGMAISAVACEAGQCVFDADCDDSSVLCNGIPPTCAPGELPRVKDQCWTGQCVKASLCSKVSSCTKCDPILHACVVHETQMGPRTHCVEIPDVCKGDISCSCLGSAVCSPPWGTCSEGNPADKQLSCSCPNC